MNKLDVEVLIFTIIIAVAVGAFFCLAVLKIDNHVNPVVVPTPIPPVTTPVVATPTPTPVVQEVNTTPTLYKVWVDTDWGFYMVRGKNVTDNLNLTINVGDTIRFINYDSYDWPVLVYGMEENPAKLRYNFESVSYTFNQSDEYAFKTESKRNRVLRVTVK